jgi:hypothetical protein
MSEQMSITQHAHAIANIAERLLWVASTLRDVNMDRLAERIELACDGIADHANEIPKLARAELDGQLDHGRQMVGALLMLGLKLAEEKRI